VTRYELLERIGAGGMAEIFRGKAVAAGGFEKPVAIKRILPHLSQDRRFVEALIAEAKILSQLRHRNIVQIFDVGLGDDGQYFLVMEFVDGMDLGNVQRGLETRRKRLPLDLVLHIGAEICEALQHAHAAPAPDGQPMRLVHRDVSPSNVLISRSGEVKLTDFGIAKRPEEQTGQHGVRGKFAYISPEQAENRHVDARSDVFSVGVLLYELALGSRLYSQLSDLDALKAVRLGSIPPPREIDPGLPNDVENILVSALSREPAERTGSAGELGAALRGVRYSLETTAGDPATELARIVASLEVSSREVAELGKSKQPHGKRRRAPSSGFDLAEPTVVRIKTAADFSAADGDSTAILRARQILDRFEEEETRFARGRGRGPFPTDEVTLSGKPQSPLSVADSGALADEETRVMSQALARRVLAADDESTQTVTQRRPGAEVAAAIAAATHPGPSAQSGPAPTLGAASPPPPPSALLRAAAAASPGGRGATASPRGARTPLPEPHVPARGESAPGGSPRSTSARVEPSVAERLAPATERDPVDRRPSGPAAASTSPRAKPAISAPTAKRFAWLGSRNQRRWLLAVAAVAVATASFLAASAVLGGGDKDKDKKAPSPATPSTVAPVPTPSSAAPIEPVTPAPPATGSGAAKPAAAKDAPKATAKPAADRTPAKAKSTRPAAKAPAKGGGKAKPTKKGTEKRRSR
jgi:eukaryotic-like serine/threonine-protein kinase